MYVISIQIGATKLWMVAVAGQLWMAALRRGWAAPTGLLSHSAAEGGGSGAVWEKPR